MNENREIFKSTMRKKNINNVRTKPQQTLYSHKYITDFISAMRFNKIKIYYCDLQKKKKKSRLF